MTTAAKVGFAALWLLVIAVSVHDGYLVLANREVMAAHERNPVGRLLIQWSDGDIWLLVAVKTIGTACAATGLLVLVAWKPVLGWIACTAVAIAQLGLLAFLYFA